MAKQAWSIHLERAIYIAAVVALWEVAAGLWIPAEFIGEPSAILRQFFAWVASGELWRHAWVTIYEALFGYLVGGCAGVIVGIVLALNPLLARTVDPVLTAVYSVPKVSFGPLFILAFGIFEPSKIALAALIVFFFLFYDTFQGVRSVSPELRDIVRIMGANPWQVFRYITWPHALEWMIDGLKISLPYAFIGAVAGEIMISSRGIGYLIRQQSDMVNITGVFAALLILLILSTLLNAVVNAFRQSVSKWRGGLSI
ncbi:MAG TPA: ABC transporter permease [Bacillota bacterium]